MMQATPQISNGQSTATTSTTFATTTMPSAGVVSSQHSLPSIAVAPQQPTVLQPGGMIAQQPGIINTQENQTGNLVNQCQTQQGGNQEQNIINQQQQQAPTQTNIQTMQVTSQNTVVQ